MCGEGNFCSCMCCRILACCHGVLYKQLSGWMLHGLLPETKEFFIVPKTQKKEVSVCNDY